MLPNARWVLYLLIVLSHRRAFAVESQQQRIGGEGQDGPWLDSAFDVFVEDTIRQLHVPGLSVAVVDDGRISSKGYGYAVLPDQNATADTQYLTGSTTKAFTAAAAGLLVHDPNRPRVKWTSPIQQFIPEDFALEDNQATAHTTIEDALSHRTGLPGHDLIEGLSDDTPSKLVRRMQYLPMTAEPRTLFQYCNNMYAAMTDMLQTIHGQNLETIFQTTFWKPLGMSSTTFANPLDGNTKQSLRLARGYYWNPLANVDATSTSQGEYVPEPYDDNTANPGAGSPYSTVNDYALWIRALLDAADSSRPANLSSPMSPRILRDLFTPRSILSEDDYELDSPYAFITPPTYALGWFTLQAGGETIVLHGGAQTGFGTSIYMLPERSFGIVTMANTVDTGNLAGGIIASRLMQQKLNLTHTPEESGFDLEERFAALSKLTSRRAARTRNVRSKPSSQLWAPTSKQTALPLPLPITDFAGGYSHPAYGPINFSTTVSHASSTLREMLEGLVYPRLNPLKIQLFHRTGTVFNVKYFSPHGLGDIMTGEGIVWEVENEDEEVNAVFSLGLSGEVESMGIEIEGAMVERAREKGERFWREGMIWFDKM